MCRIGDACLRPSCFAPPERVIPAQSDRRFLFTQPLPEKPSQPVARGCPAFARQSQESGLRQDSGPIGEDRVDKCSWGFELLPGIADTNETATTTENPPQHL